MYRLFGNLCLLFSMVALSGCGSGETFGNEEGEAISLDVMAMADAAQNEKSFADLFAEGAVPANRMDYCIRTFETNSAASVSGDSATIKVLIGAGPAGEMEGVRTTKEQPANVHTGEPVEVEWKLTKVGEQWKLTEAPLQ